MTPYLGPIDHNLEPIRSSASSSPTAASRFDVSHGGWSGVASNATTAALDPETVVSLLQDPNFRPGPRPSTFAREMGLAFWFWLATARLALRVATIAAMACASAFCCCKTSPAVKFKIRRGCAELARRGWAHERLVSCSPSDQILRSMRTCTRVYAALNLHGRVRVLAV